ncbi:response regulator transcription factor [uncultured Roseobacter sp.]|uniref:LuxR C-terminal-related transcriptional regulator n=1 Tax=uncultured Roseobacter sp. TaxID=114847 RepID=UPI002607D0DE|nr:response regulator transcription factor [uncultured Roseobacter sp.]
MSCATQLVAEEDISSILIVDDHPLYLDALESALTVMFPDCDIQKARSLGEAISVCAGRFDPQLVMFDLKLPDVSGISGFRRLRAELPSARILVISSLASVDLVQSLIGLGASGFVPKDASAKELKGVLAEIVRGHIYVPKDYRTNGAAPRDNATYASHPVLSELTPQQQRIMKLICTGKPNKQIAYELSLAEATVKAHITALLRRLGVRNRTQAVVLVEGAVARQAANEPEALAFLRN